MQSLKLFVNLEFIWCFAIGAGLWSNEFPKPEEAELPLLAFDRLLRRAGPFLPFLVFILRALQQGVLTPDKIKTDATNDWQSRNKKTTIRGPSLLYCFGVYVSITVVRWLIYFIHVSVEGLAREMELHIDHFLSDHIVLGASLVAIFQLELTLLLNGVMIKLKRNGERRERVVQDILDVLFFICALLFGFLLFAMTCGDMYYTARYFHPRRQSLAAFAIGSGFQISAFRWLKQQT